ncbi:hypothetical protein [Allonocardiopsis opalescens]|uniref:Uncharacterized protein n=1 Tax=Allonocardiopsis opalescens TaxID=1144618 RepID=A0A2T0PTP1_9ACTN|nr:hypothetical protein [Allonocardiopsis opalescens]PRX92269.1 hypothetical protein CLV72_11029 [Allonocardiopsis opalescens]
MSPSDLPDFRHAPVIDPEVPADDQTLLTLHPQLLTPATYPAPAKRKAHWEFPFLDWLRRRAIVLSIFAVLFLFLGARFIARYIGIVLGVAVLAASVATLATARRRGETKPERAARLHHGRYILPTADLDEQAQELLARARHAADRVVQARVVRDGWLDPVDNAVTLPAQIWEIAATLRTHTELRARHSTMVRTKLGKEGRQLLKEQAKALSRAETSVEARVRALEGYAARVEAAQARYHEWKQLQTLINDRQTYLDLEAETARDEHGTAQLTELTEQASTVEEAFRARLAEALDAGKQLPPPADDTPRPPPA